MACKTSLGNLEQRDRELAEIHLSSFIFRGHGNKKLEVKHGRVDGCGEAVCPPFLLR